MQPAETRCSQGFRDYLQNYNDVVQCHTFIHTHGGTMARLAKDVVVVSRPVRTFPNGDYFYIELTRRHNRYNCLLKMARDGNPEKSVIVVRAQGKTIREAEEDCYGKALERCPGFPKPPYLKRGSRTARVVSTFQLDCLEEPVEV
jgi:hypothetical protein